MLLSDLLPAQADGTANTAPKRTPAEAKLALDPWFTFPKALVALIRTGKIVGAYWIKAVIGMQTDSVKVRITSPDMAMEAYSLVTLWIAMHRLGSILPGVTDDNFKSQQANCRQTQARAVEIMERLWARQGLAPADVADRIETVKSQVRLNMPVIPIASTGAPVLTVNSVFASFFSPRHVCTGDRAMSVEHHRADWARLLRLHPEAALFATKLRKVGNRMTVQLEREDARALAAFHGITEAMCLIHNSHVVGYKKHKDPEKRAKAFFNAARTAFFKQRQYTREAVEAFNGWTDVGAGLRKVQVVAPRVPVMGRTFVSDRQLDNIMANHAMGREHLTAGVSFGLDIERLDGPHQHPAYAAPPQVIWNDWTLNDNKPFIDIYRTFTIPKRRHLNTVRVNLLEEPKVLPPKPYEQGVGCSPPEPDPIGWPEELMAPDVFNKGYPVDEAGRSMVSLYALPPVRPLPTSLAELLEQDEA